MEGTRSSQHPPAREPFAHWRDVGSEAFASVEEPTMVAERPGDTVLLERPREDRPRPLRVELEGPFPQVAVRPSATRRSTRAALTEQALGHIEAMLGDPTLTPRDVALRIAVSPRQLHRMFADRGTTFGRVLLERRLARGHALLGDLDQPIGEIAHEIGFTDPSYFARAFRIRYGMAPREARRAVR